MRRAPRQKMDGDQREWTNRRTRRLFGLAERPGVGKFTKRRLARQLRHAPMIVEE
jgi:hypothetical protein